jgi:beta-1,4-N-acetylglucosaminyltransferase
VTRRWLEPRRACWAYSPGGHLAELERATVDIVFADCFHITHAGGSEPTVAARHVYRVMHPRRRIWRTLANALQTLAILLRERPALVLSTGADVALPALVLGKLLGARIVFIETAGTIEPSLTGRLVYPLADLFIVQWPEKLDRFPHAVLGSGPLL